MFALFRIWLTAQNGLNVYQLFKSSHALAFDKANKVPGTISESVAILEEVGPPTMPCYGNYVFLHIFIVNRVCKCLWSSSIRGAGAGALIPLDARPRPARPWPKFL